MAMHRLSEIARYNPDAMARHFDSQHNWVLSEFINLALDQYLDELASELTGHEFMSRGYSPRQVDPAVRANPVNGRIGRLVEHFHRCGSFACPCSPWTRSRESSWT